MRLPDAPSLQRLKRMGVVSVMIARPYSGGGEGTGLQLALLDAARSEAARGVALVIVLHDLNLAARYADAMPVMVSGQSIA